MWYDRYGKRMTNFNLNLQQEKAVKHLDGPALVIAGAGSGKTRVLTAHICHLIEMGVSPYNILAITFTNKAANEMKERIDALVGGGAVWTSTFHSMCARILRMHADRIGYTKDFTIYTDLESERVVKRILQEHTTIDLKDKGDYIWHISRAKTLNMTPEEYYDAIKDTAEAQNVLKVYTLYEMELKKSNSLDFDDLLLKTVDLFKACPDVLDVYQNRFIHVCVDEFQDTNKLQYLIVKMLTAKHNNVFVVGDEDQSIYSWRGAEIKNILNFPKDFAGAKVYKLEQNYRSTTSILNAANNVIKYNSNRNDKTLWSEIKDDNSIEYYEAYSDRDEAERVARAIGVLTRQGASYRDVAILVRANSLTRPFEETLNLHQIPFKVFGGFRFYERKEIKDALAYIRIALNPSDNDSILRVINYPKRGIGNGAVGELQKVATEQNMTYFGVLVNLDLLPSSVQKKLAPFAEICMDLIQSVKTMDMLSFAQHAIRRSGLETYLATSGDADDQNRLENIQELINAIKQFADDNEDLTISDFMQQVSLVSDTDEMDNENYVSIATIHAVKGLEYDNVFLVGLEDGIFPTQRAIVAGDIEEERRLMYVAITRARRRLFVINARSRFRFGRVEYYPKSRFVGEMTGVKQSLRFTNSNYTAESREETRRQLGANGFDLNTFKKNTSMPTTKPQAKVKSNYDEFKKGIVVEHTKFGRGVILETSGDGEDKIASINFRGLGTKRFALAIAAPQLKIVGDADFGDI